jgi:DAK2 domain fusion protein YloV
MELYLEALRRHRDELDSLNVYPVPDGDTGTNLVRTQEGVAAALGSEAPGDSARAAGAIVARASLVGARGNSGVILSQIMRGMAEQLPDGPASAENVATALVHASEEAYRAVAHPVEGTVLTVLRDAARAGAAAATVGDDVAGVLDAAVAEGLASLERTRGALPQLRSAGVVDAGAKGVVLLLGALRAGASGDGVVDVGLESGPLAASRAGDADRNGAPSEMPLHRYEVQYLLEAADGHLAALRTALDALGDSLVVVGGGGMYNVHVHTSSPGAAVEAGIDAGRPRSISIVDLHDQVSTCIAGQARAVRAPRSRLVALAAGPGMAEALASLGAEVVSPRAPRDGTAMPVEATDHSDDTVVLTTGPGADAEPAAGSVVVVPSWPVLLAAATAFDPTASGEQNAAAMRDAAALCASGTITATVGYSVATGRAEVLPWTAEADGRIVATGSLGDVAAALVRALGGADGELATIVVGSEGERDVRTVQQAILDAAPNLRVETVRGGSEPAFALGVE